MNIALRRLLPATALLAAAALAVTGCSQASAEPTAETTETIVVDNAKPTLTQVTSNGETSFQEDRNVKREAVDVPANPTAIVTFDIATLDTLHALGAGDAVVGIPNVSLPDYLSEYSDLPKVGTLFEPDYEGVADLNPDLIVTAARSTGAYDELAEISTTIDLTAAYAGKFDPQAGLERAEQIAQIVGKQDEMASIAADIESKVDEISSQASGTALVLSVSGGEYGAFGEGSRFGYFYDSLGFTPAVPAAQLPGVEGSPHGDAVTNEFLLTANPDWIIAFDRGAATGEKGTISEVLDNELVAQTTAGKNDQIVILPASELYIVINGVTAMTNVLDTVSNALAK